MSRFQPQAITGWLCRVETTRPHIRYTEFVDLIWNMIYCKTLCMFYNVYSTINTYSDNALPFEFIKLKKMDCACEMFVIMWTRASLQLLQLRRKYKWLASVKEYEFVYISLLLGSCDEDNRSITYIRKVTHRQWIPSILHVW